MKRFNIKLIIAGLLLICFTGYAVGEETSPQIAYRILGEYINGKKGDNMILSYISFGIGGAMILAGSAGLLLKEDIISTGQISDPTVTDNWDIVCEGIIGGGVVAAVLGAGGTFFMNNSLKKEYSSIFEEKDSVVQEALAVGALYSLAEEGKQKRIYSGLTNLAVPLISMTITIFINVNDDKPWNQDILKSPASFSTNIISGIMDLFVNKSKEEKLYEKYLHIKEIMIVSGN